MANSSYLRFAYADPPYVGQARKHYNGGEVDHMALIGKLSTYDGWALSCKSSSLRDLLPLCPSATRVLSWVKPFAVFKKNVGLSYAWEPVLLVPARRRSHRDGFLMDWLRTGNVQGVGQGINGINFVGAKPKAFCFWLFDAAGLQPADELVDLYPGTGAVSRAWEAWRSQQRIVA